MLSCNILGLNFNETELKYKLFGPFILRITMKREKLHKNATPSNEIPLSFLYLGAIRFLYMFSSAQRVRFYLQPQPFLNVGLFVVGFLDDVIPSFM